MSDSCVDGWVVGVFLFILVWKVVYSVIDGVVVNGICYVGCFLWVEKMLVVFIRKFCVK